MTRLSEHDLDAIEARIRDCKTYNFGLWNADKLAHEDAPAMLNELRHLRVIASGNQGAIVNSIIERTRHEPTNTARVVTRPVGVRTQSNLSAIPFYEGKMRELDELRRQAGPSDAQVEAAAQAMFEPDGPGGDYTWAEMVVEDPSRADIWREDARKVLRAAWSAR